MHVASFYKFIKTHATGINMEIVQIDFGTQSKARNLRRFKTSIDTHDGNRCQNRASKPTLKLP